MMINNIAMVTDDRLPFLRHAATRQTLANLVADNHRTPIAEVTLATCKPAAKSPAKSQFFAMRSRVSWLGTVGGRRPLAIT